MVCSIRIIADKNGRKAIADAEKLVSTFHDAIGIHGLVNGDSEYYIAVDNYRKAIFSKKDPLNPVSDWHHNIYPVGLVNGDSRYYITEDNMGFSIYQKDSLIQHGYNRFKEAESALRNEDFKIGERLSDMPVFKSGGKLIPLQEVLKNMEKKNGNCSR